MSDEEKKGLRKLAEAWEEMQSSDRAKFLRHITKDLPTEGCEGQLVGTIIGTWMSRGTCPDCMKRILGALVDVIFLDLVEAGQLERQDPCVTEHEEEDDDGK